MEEDEFEELIEENENLRKENENLKNQLKKQGEIIWEIKKKVGFEVTYSLNINVKHWKRILEIVKCTLQFQPIRDCKMHLTCLSCRQTGYLNILTRQKLSLCVLSKQFAKRNPRIKFIWINFPFHQCLFFIAANNFF